MDDKPAVSIDGGLQIVGWRLRPLTGSHGPRLGFALHQRVTLLGIELGGKLIEFCSANAQGVKCRCGCTRRFIGFASVARVQTSQIVRDPVVETGYFVRDLS